MDTEGTRLADQRTPEAVCAPLVTIVIVNHNYGEFVEQCIQSVDVQDYPKLQCIVLECASNDNSLAIIEKALGRSRSPFFQLLRRDLNRGHVINSLSVLDDIKGAFVTFLDADDFLFPDFASTHVKAHLNDLNSAAISVTDQVQVDATGQILAGTCHWHQKWRAFEQGTAWTDLTSARTWTSNSQYRLVQMGIPRLHYVPAWWSSWLMERWIWSATSGLMFRRSAIELLAPSREHSANLRLDVGLDGYFARFAHSAGGTLVVDSALGAYRRHGKNKWSSNHILGGQTSNGPHDEVARFANSQRIARETFLTKHQELRGRLGGDLFYSIAWQLMSNREFRAFVQEHEEDRTVWEKTLKIVGAANR